MLRNDELHVLQVILDLGGLLLDSLGDDDVHGGCDVALDLEANGSSHTNELAPQALLDKVHAIVDFARALSQLSNMFTMVIKAQSGLLAHARLEILGLEDVLRQLDVDLLNCTAQVGHVLPILPQQPLDRHDRRLN